MENLNEIVAKNLIQLRKNANLTQQEFAARLSYSNKTISKWELGYAIPSLEILCEIAEFYHVSVDYFTHEHDKKRHEIKKKKTTAYMVGLIILLAAIFFIGSAVVYVAVLSFLNINLWYIFFWALSASVLVAAIASERWWYDTPWPYIFGSGAIWLILASIYFSLLGVNIAYNFWYLFFIGLPVQVAAIIILVLRHSNIKNRSSK